VGIDWRVLLPIILGFLTVVLVVVQLSVMRRHRIEEQRMTATRRTRPGVAPSVAHISGGVARRVL
jgi:hypothetical protein